ncbi:MAG TPA: hypothetical protein VH880_10455 [Anaeromyxobacteraceae bacterium]
MAAGWGAGPAGAGSAGGPSRGFLAAMLAAAAVAAVALLAERRWVAALGCAAAAGYFALRLRGTLGRRE